MNILALDWGKNKIGLALGDDVIKIASPIGVWRVDKGVDDFFVKLKSLINEEQIKKIIIGNPVSLSGLTEMKLELKSFGEAVSNLGVEVIFEDERMSTGQAIKQMRENGRHGDDDDLAAMAILQVYFDRLV